MGNIHLVTGYAGREHIKATDQAAFNAALIGTGQFVLDKGNVLKAQVINNNTIRVLDGELMMQGRFVRLDPDTYVDIAIENGAQGYYRNDLIVARYTKNTVSGVEDVNLVVIKGTAVGSNPVDPEYTEGDTTNGEAVQHDFPLWRIPLNGLNVGSPVALFGEPFMDSMRTLPDVRAMVNQIHDEVDTKLDDFDEYLNDRLDAADVKVATGSYVGTGTYGSENSNVLTFPFVPKMVTVVSHESAPMGGVSGSIYGGFPWLYGQRVGTGGVEKFSNTAGGHGVLLTWDNNKLSWASGRNAHFQLNASDTTYHWIAIG